MSRKTYEYISVVIQDRGHLDDPEFLRALCELGADGWKRSEEQAKGSSQLVILMERETVHDDPPAIQVQGISDAELARLANMLASALSRELLK